MKYLLNEAIEQSVFKARVLNLNGTGSNPSFTICSYMAKGYFTYFSYMLTIKVYVPGRVVVRTKCHLAQSLAYNKCSVSYYSCYHHYYK